MEVFQFIALLEYLLELVNYTGFLARLDPGKARSRRDDRWHFCPSGFVNFLYHLLRFALLTLAPLFSVAIYGLKLFLVLDEVSLDFLLLFVRQFVDGSANKLTPRVAVPLRSLQVTL